jgi:hypothetical protein
MIYWMLAITAVLVIVEEIGRAEDRRRREK